MSFLVKLKRMIAKCVHKYIHTDWGTVWLFNHFVCLFCLFNFWLDFMPSPPPLFVPSLPLISFQCVNYMNINWFLFSPFSILYYPSLHSLLISLAHSTHPKLGLYSILHISSYPWIAASRLLSNGLPHSPSFSLTAHTLVGVYINHLDLISCRVPQTLLIPAIIIIYISCLLYSPPLTVPLFALFRLETYNACYTGYLPPLMSLSLTLVRCVLCPWFVFMYGPYVCVKMSTHAETLFLSLVLKPWNGTHGKIKPITLIY